MNYLKQKIKVGMSLMLLIVLLPDYGHSQQLISPSANEITGTTMIVGYTIGEIAISTLSSDTQYVTQGFLQPYFLDTSMVNDVHEIYLRLNSSSEINNPDFFTENEKLTHYRLYSISGAKVSEGSTNEIDRLKVSDLPTGVYVLYVFSEKHEYFQTYKIIKQ